MSCRALLVIGVAGLAGCHLLLPFGDEMPGRADRGITNGSRVDGGGSDRSWTCINSSFAVATDMKLLEVVQGNWTWVSGAARQSDVNIHGALAVLGGSTDVVNRAALFRATVSLRATDLLENGFPQGGGLSVLLGRNGSQTENLPDRQLTCTASALPGSHSSNVVVIPWNGKTQAPDPLAYAEVADLTLVGSTVELTMEINRSGNSWFMSCALTDGAGHEGSTRVDISAEYVQPTATGVGLFTTGAVGNFLDVSLCH